MQIVDEMLNICLNYGKYENWQSLVFLWNNKYNFKSYVKQKKFDVSYSISKQNWIKTKNTVMNENVAMSCSTRKPTRQTSTWKQLIYKSAA